MPLQDLQPTGAVPEVMIRCARCPVAAGRVHVPARVAGIALLIDLPPRYGTRPDLRAYLLALLAVALALGLRGLLDPWLADHAPFITIFPAIAAAVWFGGYRPALLVTVVGYLACHLWFLEPRGIFAFERQQVLVGLLVYLLSSACIIALGEAMRSAHREVRARRHMLRLTLGSIADAVIATDRHARIQYLNPVAEELTGCPPHEALGQPLEHVCQFLDEATRAQEPDLVAHVLASGSAYLVDRPLLILGRDGAERPIESSAAPIRDSEGNPVGCVLVLRDLGERRRAELELNRAAQELRESGELFRTMADNISQLAWMADERGRVFWYNQRWFDYTGTTLEQMQGGGWKQVHHPDHVERVAARVQRSWDTGEPWEDTFPLRSKDGEYRWFLSRALPIRDADGRVLRWFGTNTDITAQKQAVEALANAERQMRLITNHAPVLIAHCDVHGRFKFVNRPYAERFGTTPEAIAGKHVAEVLGEAAYATIRERMAETLSGRAVEFDVEVQFKAGTPQFMRCAYAPEHDEQGSVVGLVAAIVNITERRRVEQQLQEADRRKDEFLATLAHELRNPLAPIRNSLELMKRAGADAALLAVARDTMGRQVTLMQRLIDDLLDVSRITRNALELRRQQVDLAEIVGQAIEASQPLADEAGHAILVELPPEPIRLDGDPVRLAQVFSNLLNNACKYTPPGGRIELIVQRSHSEVTVTVRDNGIGIEPALLPRVFEIFEQGDRSLERTQGGLGIGLTLVKQLVELHGGRVEARSAGSGHGSTFTVRLPVQTLAASNGMPPLPGPQDPDAPPRRVLVVDDNQDGAESLAMLLRIAGHETRLAHDGLAAVETAQEFAPHLILLDIGLPKLNGYEVAQRIRDSALGHEVTLVALTGWGQQEDRRRSKEAGFDGHLVKPVDYAELMSWIAPGSSSRETAH